MRRKSNILYAISVCLILVFSTFDIKAQQENKKETSSRVERNFIRQGNKLYGEKRYAEAEVEYKKALQTNPGSNVATYNLATSLIRQGGAAKDKNSPLKQATDLLNNLVKTSNDNMLLSKAYYNLGNLAFNQEQYDQSVEQYKNALRKNPNDEQARQNLRLAQKKLQEQQKDKKDDNKNDKDKDKNKDKQDQDKNKDKQDKDKQNKQDQQDKQNKQDNQNKDKKQNQGGMSDGNADQILKAMQNAEQGTQQKMNASKAQEDKKARRNTRNQW